MTTSTNNLADQDNITYCAHPGCRCQVQTGDKYCCSICEKQQDEGPCKCGHSDCQLDHQDMS